MAGLSGLAGLSGAYPGYQAAENIDQDIQKKRLGNQDTQAGIIGDKISAGALQLLFQGSGATAGGSSPGPQQPSAPAGGGMPPGQAGMPPPQPPGGMFGGMNSTPVGWPAPPGGGPGMPSPQPAGGPGMPPQSPMQPRPPMQQPPQMGGGQQGPPKLSLEAIVGAVVKSAQMQGQQATPQAIMKAVNGFLPLMNAQALAQWRLAQEQFKQQQGERSDTRIKDTEKWRAEQGGRSDRRLADQEAEAGRKRTEGERRGDQRDREIGIKEKDLARKELQDKVRHDDRLQAMRVQLDKAEQAKDINRQKLIMQQMHYRAMEVIQGWGTAGKKAVSPEELKAILDENRKMFREKIDELGSGASGVNPDKPPGKQSSLDEGRAMSDADPERIKPGAQYASSVSKNPKGDVPVVRIPIRSQKSLQRALDNAEGDEDLERIKRLLEKRGYDSSFIR